LVKLGIGGFCVFKGSQAETESMTAELQALATIPLIFSADFEYGLPMRLTGGTEFPHAMAMGQNESTEFTYTSAQAIAIETRSLGIHWNFAPVCDINSNPENPIINIRAFGETSDDVIKHSFAFIKGTQDKKVLACAKHFPGHGDTSVDSHLELPVLNRSEKEIRENELKPFIYAVENDVRSIMTGHLSVPSLDSTGLPASLSYKITTELLRDELNFKGLIITDALEMKAISEKYTSGESTVLAIEAGADIALMPDDPIEAIKALINRADTDIEFRQRLVDSVRRINRDKKWCSAIGHNPNNISRNDVKYDHHEKLALITAEKAIEIVGKKTLIPIKEDLQIAGFAFLQDGVQQTENMNKASMFFKIFAQAIENNCDFAFVDEKINEADVYALNQGTKDAQIVILAFFYKAQAYKGSVGATEEMLRAAERLAMGKPVIAVFFGNPYLADEVKADTYVSAFSDTLPSIAATILKLSGREPFPDVETGQSKN